MCCCRTCAASHVRGARLRDHQHSSGKPNHQERACRPRRSDSLRCRPRLAGLHQRLVLVCISREPACVGAAALGVKGNRLGAGDVAGVAGDALIGAVAQRGLVAGLRQAWCAAVISVSMAQAGASGSAWAAGNVDRGYNDGPQ